ncbi:hypothetical protein BH11PSE11_BH11PSE11_28400 [soil metagenome]
MLGRLMLAQKFVILSVVALLMACIPATLYVLEADERLDAALAEQRGIVPLADLQKVVRLTQQHRASSAILLAGTESGAAARAAKRHDADLAYERMSATVATIGDRTIQEKWLASRSAWEDLCRQIDRHGVSSGQSYQAHVDLIAGQLALHELIADYFGLSLDPDRDAYQLIQFMYYQLPYLTEETGRMRAKGAEILTQHTVSDEALLQISSIMTRAGDRFELVSRTFGKAAAANPLIGTALAEDLRKVSDLLDHVIQITSRNIVKVAAPSYSPENYVATMTTAIDTQFSLSQHAEVVLKNRLSEKIAELNRTRRLLLAAMLALILLTGLIQYAIAQSVARPAARAVAVAAALTEGAAEKLDAATAIASGNLDREFRLTTVPEFEQDSMSRDEMGVLLRSMVRMSQMQRSFDEAFQAMTVSLRKSRDEVEAAILENRRQVLELERVSAYKSAFLANMSHEIRTPMHAILGYAQLMGRRPELPSDIRKYVEIIDRSGDHLLALINSILEMTKIEAGRVALQVQELNVAMLMGDIESMLKERATDKSLTLEFAVRSGMPAVLHTDPTKLRQILVNIIGNAIKFTDRGGVSVAADAVMQADGSHVVHIDVSDTGSGIAAEDLARIFAAFEQSESGYRKGGTGLGMTISREYARMMGGDVTLESSLGQGTVVHFSFVSRPGAAVVTALPSAGSRNSAGRLVGLTDGSIMPAILIVDDVASNCDILKLMLTRAGLMKVDQTMNASAVMDIVRGSRPDIVLMDRCMPDIDGLELTRQIKGDAALRATRVIIVTASAFEEDRQLAFESGADGFISKPFREQEVLAEIKRSFPRAEFLHEQNQAHQKKPDANGDYRREVADLKPALVTELLEMIECGDVLRFEQSIAEHLLDGHPQLHAYMHELVERFDYSRIVTVLKRQ